MNTVAIKLQDLEIAILGNLPYGKCSHLTEKIMSFVHDSAQAGMPVSKVSAPCVCLEDSLYTVWISGDGAMSGESDYNLWLVESDDSLGESEIYDCANNCYVSGKVIDYSSLFSYLRCFFTLRNRNRSDSFHRLTCIFSGANERIRTADLRITSALLYQLSHVGNTASLRSARMKYTERAAGLQGADVRFLHISTARSNGAFKRAQIAHSDRVRAELSHAG